MFRQWCVNPKKIYILLTQIFLRMVCLLIEKYWIFLLNKNTTILRITKPTELQGSNYVIFFR